MKPRTTLMLLTLVLLVGALVVLDHFKGTSTEQAEEKGQHVLDIHSGDITWLELVHTNQTIVIEKSGDNWNITQPLQVRADESTINALLSDLEFAQRDRTLTEKELSGVNLADFGLDQPQVSVTVTGRNGAVTLLVGRETPTKDALYVQIQGQKQVEVTPKNLLSRLNSSLNNLRSHIAVEITPSAVTRLELKSADRVIELAKTAASTNAEPRWAIVRPLPARANQRRVNELINDLSALPVQDFISEDPKDAHTYQLDEPEREITVWTGDAGKTLLMSRPSTNDPATVYAKLKSGDSIFTVRTVLADRFPFQVEDLRDPQVLTVAPGDVSGIDLLQGTNKISLTRGDKGWTVALSAPTPVDSLSVDQFLGRFTGLTAQRFAADVAVDLDKYGLAAPTATVTLLGQGTNVLAQLLIGGLDETNKLRYVKRADEPFIYGVDPGIVDWLPASALAMRARRLAPFEPGQVTKLTIQNGPSRVVLVRDAQNKWHLIEPAQGVLDNDGLQRLLDAFAHLSAEQFIREGRDNLAEYGLDAPGFSLTAQTGENTYTLALGKSPVPGLQFALWTDPPLLFTLKTPAVDDLTNQIVAGTVPAPAPTNAAPPAVTATNPASPAAPSPATP
jgi:hypothetical protein